MEHYAAIDVSLEWSSVCVVDAAGQIVREARVRSEREALAGYGKRGLWSNLGDEVGGGVSSVMDEVTAGRIRHGRGYRR